MTPHDHLIKYVFSRPETAASWFTEVLPAVLVQQLNFDKLKLEPGAYVDEALQDQHTDLLYSVPLRASRGKVFLYLLFEHQSRPDPLMAWRLLRYQVRIWDQYLSKNPKKHQLPPILPIVLYNGTHSWKAPKRFEQLHPDAIRPYLGPFMLTQAFHLEDLGRTSEAALKGNVLAHLTQVLLRQAQTGKLWDRLPELAGALREILRGTGLQAVHALLRYIFEVEAAAPSPEVVERLRLTFNEPEEPIMSYASQLIEEGERRGMLKGRQEGRQEGKSQMLRRLALRRFPGTEAQVDAWLASATPEQLDAAVDRLLSAATIEELLQG